MSMHYAQILEYVKMVIVNENSDISLTFLSQLQSWYTLEPPHK